MRVLLVKPHIDLPIADRLQKGFLHLEPLELEIVAGGVSADDEVRILDLSLERDGPRALHDSVASYQPDLIGFTGYSTVLHLVLQLASQVKRQRPGVCVVVGGTHATLRPGDYRNDAVDAIVRGDGGTVIGTIVDRRKRGQSLAQGTAVLVPSDPDFERLAAEPIPAYPPIDTIPLPRRDLVDRSRYFCVWTSVDDRRPATIFPRVASLRTSAGCPFRCSFCAIHHMMGGRYATRSPECVVDELAAIAEDHIYFVDDEMFVDARRALRIAELIKARGIRKRYISWARSDTIIKHPEIFEAWKAIGLDVVYVGLESMESSRLQEYDKRTTVESNLQATAILKTMGIILHAALIVHPDFTVREFRALEHSLRDLAPAEFTFTVLSPSPGTAFWRETRDHFICDPFRYYDCMHTLLPTRLPLKRFYQHFGRVSALGLRMNPLRMHRIRVPPRELWRAISGGLRYVVALYRIYRDYPASLWHCHGADLETQYKNANDGLHEYR